MVAVGHGKVTRCVSDASAMQQRIDGGLLMGDGACTVAPSLTLRVTSGSLPLRVSDDGIVAVGHAMVTRYVSEEAAERRSVS